MRNILIVFLCLVLVLVLLTSCTGKQRVYETEISLKEEGFENPVTIEDLIQLYTDNEVFDNVIYELKKLPEDVCFVTFDNNEIFFYNNTNQIISTNLQYDYYIYVDCFEELYNFANTKLKIEYRIFISKTDYGYSFTIRSLNMLIDYSIIYCNELNVATESFTNINGPWFVNIVGLV